MTAIERTFVESQKIPGAFGEGDTHVLYHLIKSLEPNSLLVEIGCYYGRSSFITYKNMPKNSVFYTVDPFTGTERDKNPEQYQKMITNMVKYDFWPRIIHSTSQRAFQLFEKNSIDFLFIDGWHSYDCVCADIQNFLSKMKSGGIISGHDWSNYETVRLAVLNYFSEDKIVTYSGLHSSIWSVKI